MRSLLTKTLFTSLLSSVAISSGVQAGFSAADAKKFAKIGVTAGVGVMGKIVGKVVAKERSSPLIEKEIVEGIGVVTGVTAEAALGIVIMRKITNLFDEKLQKNKQLGRL